MKKMLMLVAILLIPLDLWAGSSAALALSGTVKEKIDYQVRFDSHQQRWVLEQKTNGHLRASLEQTKNSQYVVTVRAP